MRFLFASLYVKVKIRRIWSLGAIKEDDPSMICSLMQCISSTEARTQPKTYIWGGFSLYISFEGPMLHSVTLQ